MELNQYNYYNAAFQQNLEDSEKAEELKRRLLPFSEIENFEEAKQLAKQIIPTNQEYTHFYAGNAKCSIVNKPDSFRICVSTANEFICYDFIK